MPKCLRLHISVFISRLSFYVVFFAAMWIDFVLQHGSREEHMPSFLRWLSDHGVDTSAVAIEQFADAGYGLKAMRDIRVSTVM